MQSNIVQPFDDSDVNTGKNYLVNKLTMNPDGSIDEARFAIGIFYVKPDGKLYQATNIDEGFTIKKMPNNISTPQFTRNTEAATKVTLTFISGLTNPELWIVLLIRDNFDSRLTPIFRKNIDSELYDPGNDFTIDKIEYNLNFSDPEEYFVFN